MTTTAERRISLAHVELNEQAKKNVQECLDTGMLARGRFVEEFEEKVAEFTGGRYGVAVCNGTMADVVVLQAMRELYAYHAVRMPALTFAAQWSAAVLAGMEIQSVDFLGCFLDPREEPLPGVLRFGTNLLGTLTHASSRDVIDSCETFARDTAKTARAVTYSFYATHAIGTGEGGMIVTNDRDVRDFCRSSRDHGQMPPGVISKFRHHYLGHNAKMANIAAAIGCGLLEDADDIIHRRRLVAQWYDERLGGITSPSFTKDGNEQGPYGDGWAERLVSPHGYPYSCHERDARDRTLRRLAAAGIDARRLFSVLPREPAFQFLGLDGDYPTATKIADWFLYLPCHHGMTKDDVDYVAGVLGEV